MYPTWYMARPARLERATCGFVVRRSIQLSYGRTFSFQGWLARRSLGVGWRRERDSNPRSRFCRNTRFPIVPLQPLGHLSVLFILSLIQLRLLSNNSDLSAFAEREGCARSLRSLRLPRLWRGRRTLGPDFVGTHDFQSCPFSLSGISPFYLTLCA
jgi:hypothetical protein